MYKLVHCCSYIQPISSNSIASPGSFCLVDLYSIGSSIKLLFGSENRSFLPWNIFCQKKEANRVCNPTLKPIIITITPRNVPYSFPNLLSMRGATSYATSSMTDKSLKVVSTTYIIRASQYIIKFEFPATLFFHQDVVKRCPGIFFHCTRGT